jgi:antitoxin HigA-1
MPRQPTHPGALLREDVLPALRRPKTEIADLLGISRQHLHAILGERQGITADVAVRLGKLCGNGPELWINMQQNFDLWQAKKRLAADIKRIPTLRAA